MGTEISSRSATPTSPTATAGRRSPQELDVDPPVALTLNHPELRSLIAQEMLRRCGADLPEQLAYIPNVVKIMMELEDYPRLTQLSRGREAAACRNSSSWLDAKLSILTVDEVKGGEPATPVQVIYDVLARRRLQYRPFLPGHGNPERLRLLPEGAHSHHDIEHI